MSMAECYGTYQCNRECIAVNGNQTCQTEEDCQQSGFCSDQVYFQFEGMVLDGICIFPQLEAEYGGTYDGTI
jgi:hypothetical protein